MARAALSRSETMARIHRRDTSPELALRRLLHAGGFRYRVDYLIPGIGRIDIVFPSRKVAIFVDGCFWHRCPDHGVSPKNNPAFWEKKLSRNAERDRDQAAKLGSIGWTVVRVWEHEIKSDPSSAFARVLSVLNKPSEGES